MGKHLLNPAVVERLKREATRAFCGIRFRAIGLDPEGWLDRAFADYQSRDWTLLVLHDIPTGAMAHLEEFIAACEQRAGFEFTQEFPPDCVPILDGKVVLPLDRLRERLKTTGQRWRAASPRVHLHANSST